jgi:hypothetical protein
MHILLTHRLNPTADLQDEVSHGGGDLKPNVVSTQPMVHRQHRCGQVQHPPDRPGLPLRVVPHSALVRL